MGKRGQWGGYGNGQGHGQGQKPRGGSYWRGSWERYPPKDDKSKRTRNPFPGYDSEWEDRDREIIPVCETKLAKPTPDQFTRQVQSAVNGARKIDGRVTKLVAELQQKEQLWNTYVHKAKASFVQEFMRHQGDLARLKKDLQEAQANQQEAHQQLRGVMSGGPPDTGGHSSTAAEFWDTSIQEAVAAEMELDETDAMEMEVVQMAQQLILKRRSEEAAGLPHFGGDGLRTPPQKGQRVPPLTPPASSTAGHYSGKDDVQVPDPFVTSPSTKVLGIATEGEVAPPPPADLEGTAELQAALIKASRALKARQSVKAHTPPRRPDVSGPGLAGKLEARRASALQPFRRGATMTEEPPGGKSGAAPVPSHAVDVEEDLDSAGPGAGPGAPDGSTSPGLGKME